MAGRRRTRSTSKELKPTVRATRLENRQAALAAKWGAAQSPAERAVVAARHYQGTRSRRQPDQILAAQMDRRVEELALELRQYAERLLADQVREPLDPGRGHAA